MAESTFSSPYIDINNKNYQFFADNKTGFNKSGENINFFDEYLVQNQNSNQLQTDNPDMKYYNNTMEYGTDYRIVTREPKKSDSYQNNIDPICGSGILRKLLSSEIKNEHLPPSKIDHLESSTLYPHTNREYEPNKSVMAYQLQNCNGSVSNTQLKPTSPTTSTFNGLSLTPKVHNHPDIDALSLTPSPSTPDLYNVSLPNMASPNLLNIQNPHTPPMSEEDASCPIPFTQNASSSQNMTYPWMGNGRNKVRGKDTKRTRQTYTREQITALEMRFSGGAYLTRQSRLEMSRNLKLTERQIKIWFQNRRMKEKKFGTLSPASPKMLNMQAEISSTSISTPQNNQDINIAPPLQYDQCSISHEQNALHNRFEYEKRLESQQQQFVHPHIYPYDLNQRSLPHQYLAHQYMNHTHIQHPYSQQPPFNNVQAGYTHYPYSSISNPSYTPRGCYGQPSQDAPVPVP